MDRAGEVGVDLGDGLGEDRDGAALTGEGEGALAADAARACTGGRGRSWAVSARSAKPDGPLPECGCTERSSELNYINHKH